jgi:hypothetical protein
METAVETREIDPIYPLGFLERGGDKINANWPIGKAVKFIKICQKRYKESEIIIRTHQPERKLQISYGLQNPLFHTTDDQPKSEIVITNHFETTELKNGRKFIYPTEYLMIITLDTTNIFVQGNPPIKKIELSTLLTREKTKSTITKEIGKIPNKWRFNPIPR